MPTHSILNYSLHQMLQDFTSEISVIFTTFHPCGTKSYLKSTWKEQSW